MKLLKSFMGVAAVLMTIGLLASCQNAANPDRVSSVKASDLKESGAKTQVTKEDAEKVVKSIMKEESIVPGLFSVDANASDYSKAGIMMSVARAASGSGSKEAFDDVTKAVTQFTEDLKKKGSATLKVSESETFDAKTNVPNLGLVTEGSASVKANVTVKDNSFVSKEAVQKGDISALKDSLKIDYSVNGSASAKASVRLDIDSSSPIMDAKTNASAKAQIKKVGFKFSKDGTEFSGSYAASVSEAFGMTFKTSDDVGGKIFSTVKVSSKGDAESLKAVVGTAMGSVMTGNFSMSGVDKKALEELLSLEIEVTVCTDDGSVVWSKSFDSLEVYETWCKA